MVDQVVEEDQDLVVEVVVLIRRLLTHILLVRTNKVEMAEMEVDLLLIMVAAVVAEAETEAGEAKKTEKKKRRARAGTHPSASIRPEARRRAATSTPWGRPAPTATSS